MHRRALVWPLCPLAAIVVLAAACSGGSRASSFSGGDGDAGSDPGDAAFATGATGGGGGSSGYVCAPNSANFDIPNNNCDDDGDGKVDNPPTCDTGLSTTGDAASFAKAIGICDTADKRGFGLVSATYTRGYKRSDEPAAEQHGILSKFGSVVKPREGTMLGVLSSGYAREYDGTSGTAPFGGKPPNGKDWFGAIPIVGNGSVPPGFPKTSQDCPQLDSATNDVIDVQLELKAPPNAGGIKFDFDFYSSEWPAYICSAYNDAFIAYLSAKGFNGGKPDNVSFDSKKNPVSVNNGFFDRCTAGVPMDCNGGGGAGTWTCAGGTGELQGTGFYNMGKYCAMQSTGGGATGWLTTQAPVKGGETFTIEFMVWDTGDAILDSTVLLDNFTWIEGTSEATTERPK